MSCYECIKYDVCIFDQNLGNEFNKHMYAIFRRINGEGSLSLFKGFVAQNCKFFVKKETE